MSKKAFYHNERRRHHYASPSDSRNNTNCASLSCDVDAKISCGGKTFQSKLIGNDGKGRYSKNVMVLIFDISNDFHFYIISIDLMTHSL